MVEIMEMMATSFKKKKKKISRGYPIQCILIEE